MFVTEIAVRGCDLDEMGSLRPSGVAELLQEARVAFLLDGDNAHLLGGGVIVVAHRLAIEPEPVVAGDVRVEVLVGAVKATSFWLDYRITQGDRLLATASSHMCIFDFGLQKPVRMTAAERAWFTDRSGGASDFITAPAPDLSDAPGADFVVRWSDLDSYGHVNNAQFLGYLAGTLPLEGRRVASWEVRYLRQLEHRREPYRVQWRLGEGGLDAAIVDPASGAVAASARLEFAD